MRGPFAESGRQAPQQLDEPHRLLRRVEVVAVQYTVVIRREAEVSTSLCVRWIVAPQRQPVFPSQAQREFEDILPAAVRGQGKGADGPDQPGFDYGGLTGFILDQLRAGSTSLRSPRRSRTGSSA